MRFALIALLSLLMFYAALCLKARGEVLDVLEGKVHQCDVLGGSEQSGLIHATIKTVDGRFIISGLEECSVGYPVDVYIKRGALFFNTVFSTQKN